MDCLPTESTLSDSWVALTFDDPTETNLCTPNSPYNSSMERLLCEAQCESSASSISSSNSSFSIKSSPRPLSNASSLKVTPHISGPNSPVSSAKLEEVLPKLMTDDKNTDWVWNWSSQPTNTPPKESQLRHPKPSRTPLSIRNTDVMKSDLFSWKFLQIVIPSFIVSNLLAFGIGFLIGRKFTNASKNS